MFLQEHFWPRLLSARYALLSTRYLKLSDADARTVYLLEALQTERTFLRERFSRLRSWVERKVEKCSCRNTVENFGRGVCILQHYAINSHFFILIGYIFTLFPYFSVFNPTCSKGSPGIAYRRVAMAITRDREVGTDAGSSQLNRGKAA